MQNPTEKPRNSATSEISPGRRFRQALEAESPLQIAGTINPISALLAQQAGFRAIYLSGAGVANASHGLPDLGVTHLEDVLEDARRITYICQLPLLVDIDTGWGTEGTIERTIREMHRAGVAAVHIEDQVSAKRCGHRPGKQVVSSQEMQARIHAACQGRVDPDFVIMARTDALAIEGLAAAIERANAYVAVGADMIFAEAITSLEDYQTFAREVPVPILANMTEFGKSPLLDISQLRSVGIQMVLYPLSAFRAMNQAARVVYETIRREGTQACVLTTMQTRDELYELLGYLQSEEKTNLGTSKS
jgi:methylisocitrate lyase